MARPLSAQMRAWVEQNRDKHVCACGCGSFIRVVGRHRWEGIPKYHRGHYRNPRAAADRFWEKVAKGDGCWEYTGSRDRQGYGFFRTGVGTGRAHRFSWELHNGPVPPGLCVLHQCDNPSCCNPAHLFLGTHADNAADREAKGRGSRPDALRGSASFSGSQNPSAKLTEQEVSALRRDAAAGEPRRVLMARYGLGRTAVWDIINRRRWKHV